MIDLIKFTMVAVLVKVCLPALDFFMIFNFRAFMIDVRP